jgi:hypothetical protein
LHRRADQVAGDVDSAWARFTSQDVSTWTPPVSRGVLNRAAVIFTAFAVFAAGGTLAWIAFRPGTHGGSLVSASGGPGKPSIVTTPSISKRLAASPEDCTNLGASPTKVGPWLYALGSGPAFGVGFGLDHSGAYHTGNNNVQKTSNGWGIKILWVLRPGTHQTVAISGSETGTGWPIIFQPSGAPTSSTMTLDPKHPGTPTKERGWLGYPSLVAFPEAGCYTIKATWSNGAWTRGLGFGR